MKIKFKKKPKEKQLVDYWKDDVEFRIDAMEQQSKAMKEFWSHPRKARQLSDKVREANRKPENRKKMSESTKKIWEDPVEREKRIAKIKARMKDPDVIKKMKEGRERRKKFREQQTTKEEN